MVFGLSSDPTLGIRVFVDGQRQVSRAMRSIEGSVASVGQTARVAGAALTAFGAAGAAGFGAAVKAAADWETQMAEVRKTTGLTAEEMKVLDSGLRDLSGAMPVSTQQIADTAAVAGQLGISGTRNILRFTEVASKAGVATALSAEEAATAMGRMANALSLPIDEAENMMSAINALSNTTASDSREITGSMLNAAGAAATLGVSFEDLSAMSATLVSAGMPVERSGTRLTRMMNELAGNTDMAAEALGMPRREFEALVESDPSRAIQLVIAQIAEMDSKAGKLTLAEDLFGPAGAKAAVTLANNMEGLNKNLATSRKEYGAALSLQEEFVIQSETFAGQLQEVRNQMHFLAVTVGEEVIPHLEPLVNHVRSAVNWFQSLDEGTKSLVIRAGLLATAIGLIGGPMLIVISLLPAMAAGLGMVGTALTVLTGPIGLVAVAIAVLAAAWKLNVFGIRDKTLWMVNKLKALFGGLKSWLGSNWKQAVPALLAGPLGVAALVWNENLFGIRDKTSEVLNGVKAFFVSWGGKLKTVVSEVGSAAGRSLWEAFRGAFNALVPSSIHIPGFSVAGFRYGGFDIGLPRLATGGFIERGGLALLHPGERVLPAAEADRRGGGGGVTIRSLTIHASSRREGRAAAKGFAEELRSHGFNNGGGL